MSFDKFKQRFPILVPYWVLKQLERNKLPFNTVLNLEKMLTISSREDLAIMLVMNTDPSASVSFFGAIPAEGLSHYWADYYNDQYKKVQEVSVLYRGKLDERLIAPPTPNDVVPEYPNPFEIKPVDSEQDAAGALLVIVYPGYFGGPKSREIQKQLVREYLKLSYVFIDYDTVARDPLFQQYMRTSISEPA